MNDKKIPAPQYIVGHEFTERLKEVTGCTTFGELSKVFDVPKATFSAWNLHDRTSHELIVRLHLAMGIPVEKLALGIDSGSNINHNNISEPFPEYQQQKIIQKTDPQLATSIVKSFCLTNGKLIDTGVVPYADRRLNRFGLDADLIEEIETNEAIYLVDRSITNAVSGKFLIDIDGNLSINHIQRLPGKKLAVVIGDATVEISDDDIEVKGRVAVTLKKD